MIHLTKEENPERRKEQKAVVRLDDKEQQVELSAFPLKVGRYQIKLVKTDKKSSSFVVSEVPCRDTDFKKIESNSSSSSICTPIITEPDWHGIAINAPGEIHYKHSLDTDYIDRDYVIRKEPKVIIAGTYTYECAKLGREKFTRDGHPLLMIKNTATDQAWGQTIQEIERGYIHHVLGMNVSYDDRDFHIDNEDDESGTTKPTSVGGWFNADIGMHLERPSEPVDYEVYIEYGPYRSNTVKITVHP
ncbi:MAG: hypothetical protein JRJ87_06570 [Deltaproteobacteria bacterium]|nr:hypothetical protein [Deltaproteobacteria bacterium]